MSINVFCFTKDITVSTSETVTLEPLFIPKQWSITIENTGNTNAITSVTVKKASVTGRVKEGVTGIYANDNALTTAIGSIAANTTAPAIELGDCAFAGLELVFASTNTTVTIQVTATA